MINKIRNDHDVQINFPRKGDPEEHTITIIGYKDNAYSARGDIMKIVNELVSVFIKSPTLHNGYYCSTIPFV